MSWLQALRDRYSVSADPLRTQRRIELLALLLGLALCLQLAYSVVRLATLEAPAMVEPAADSMRVPPVRTRAEVAEEERSDILSRPLFWSSRRPVAAAPSTPTPTGARETAAGKLGDIKQVGVFGSGDEAGIIALVKGKKRRILLGEELEGWTLESVSPTESEFARGGRSETLTLRRGKVTAPGSGDAKAASRGEAPAPEKEKAPSPASGEAQEATSRELDGLSLGQRGWRQPPNE